MGGRLFGRVSLLTAPAVRIGHLPPNIKWADPQSLKLNRSTSRSRSTRSRRSRRSRRLSNQITAMLAPARSFLLSTKAIRCVVPTASSSNVVVVMPTRAIKTSQSVVQPATKLFSTTTTTQTASTRSPFCQRQLVPSAAYQVLTRHHSHAAHIYSRMSALHSTT